MQRTVTYPGNYINGSAKPLQPNCVTNHNRADVLNQYNLEKKQLPSSSKGENMSILANYEQNSMCAQTHFTPKQIEILKNSICKGVSDEEFEVFLMACVKTKLDPFMRQIYAVKRKCKKPDGSWGEVMTIQTGIDGYRLIAERTEKYAPGQEPTYSHDQNGNLLSATAYVKKMTSDGTWHNVSSSAYIDEYCQRSRDGNPMGMWGNMPRTMLAKCAEAQALRKAFPAEMSGVYTKEEMQQADVEEISPKITPNQVNELKNILLECDPSYQTWVCDTLKKQYSIDDLINMPLDLYSKVKNAAIKSMESFKSKSMQTISMEQSVFAEAR